MSGGVACTCIRNLSDAGLKSIFRKQNWVVIKRNCNYSAFNGYHRAYSNYSEIHCKRCRALWRTTANYVEQLRDGTL